MKSEERILSELRAGVAVEESFELLFRRYYGWVRGSLMSRGLSREIAEELSQEVFTAVYRYKRSCPAEVEAFRRWLFRIVKSKYLNEVERRGRKKRDAPVTSLDSLRSSGVDLAQGSEVDSEDKILEAERARQLREAIATLPERQRDCLALQIFQELGVREIASVLRIAPGTVKAHLFQARQALRAKLSDDPEDIDRLKTVDP